MYHVLYMHIIALVIYFCYHVSFMIILLRLNARHFSIGTAALQDDTNDKLVQQNKKKKNTNIIDDGISLEVFHLSDQANVLYDRGILPLNKLPSSKLTAQKGKNTKNKPDLSLKSEVKSNMNIIRLDGEVLIQNNEVTEVDPLLLTVPLPIQTLQSLKNNGSSTSSSNVIVSFEHSFPSEWEINENAGMELLSKKHVLKIIEESTKIGGVISMRDPHFILYISKLLDKSTRNALCKSLLDGSITIPGNVKIALQMIALSIGDSNSSSSSGKDKNSVARRSGRLIEDDDDEDD